MQEVGVTWSVNLGVGMLRVTNLCVWVVAHDCDHPPLSPTPSFTLIPLGTFSNLSS